jgi:hypothetical protein
MEGRCYGLKGSPSQVPSPREGRCTRTLKVPQFRQQMRGTIHEPVGCARLLLLAVTLLFGCVPTVQAMRCPTPGPLLDSLQSQLNEEMPSQESVACYAVWVVDSQGRIGLFVGNNPINNIDPFGLTWYIEPPLPEGYYGPPHAEWVEDGHDWIVQIPAQSERQPIAWQMPPILELAPGQLLGARGLATRQVRHLMYSSKRSNAGATHIPRCPGQPPGRPKRCQALRTARANRVRNATAFGYVAPAYARD